MRNVMKKTSIVFLVLLLGLITAAQADDVVSLYQKKHYQTVIDAVTKSTTADPNVLYYGALSYVQLGQTAKASDIMLSLLAMDPHFYAYKLRFDPEIYPVLKHGDMMNTVAAYETGKLAQSIRFKHQLVRTDAGLYLFANGVKYLLGDAANVSGGGFMNDDRLYYIEKTAAGKKGENCRVTFYNVVNKATLGVYELPGSFVSAKNLKGNQLLMQTASTYQLFDAKRLSPLSAVTEGYYVEPPAP